MIHTHTKVILSISIALLLASVSALSIFFYRLETQKAAYETMRTEEAERLARIASLSALTETLEATKEDREIIAAHVLSEDGVVELLALIETLAREARVVLSTDTLTVESINTQFEELIATISVEGQYAAVLHMLELFERLPYETRIDTVNLDQSTNNWRGVFQIRILKFKGV
jgi:Tfp pilus assembly protein PilO